jgi:hypothetical protein
MQLPQDGQIKNLGLVTRFSSSRYLENRNDRSAKLRQKYETILEEVNQKPQTYEKNLSKLQKLILLEGIPSETEVKTKDYHN